MSLGRVFGLAIVAIWLVVAVGFALADISILVDPRSRRAEHVCTDEASHRTSIGYDLSDQDCFPRLAMRGGFDALMVGLPMIVGVALAGRRKRH